MLLGCGHDALLALVIAIIIIVKTIIVIIVKNNLSFLFPSKNSPVNFTATMLFLIEIDVSIVTLASAWLHMQISHIVDGAYSVILCDVVAAVQRVRFQM